MLSRERPARPGSNVEGLSRKKGKEGNCYPPKKNREKKYTTGKKDDRPVLRGNKKRGPSGGGAGQPQEVAGKKKRGSRCAAKRYGLHERKGNSPNSTRKEKKEKRMWPDQSTFTSQKDGKREKKRRSYDLLTV